MDSALPIFFLPLGIMVVMLFVGYFIPLKYVFLAKRYCKKYLKPGYRVREYGCYGFNISKNGNGTWEVYVLIVGKDLLMDGWTNGRITFSPSGQMLRNDVVQKEECFFNSEASEEPLVPAVDKPFFRGASKSVLYNRANLYRWGYDYNWDR